VKFKTFKKDIYLNKAGNVRINVALRSVRVTTDAVEKQKCFPVFVP
jgi:hypothetical protein